MAFRKVALLGYVLYAVSFARASDFQSPRVIALGGASHASPLLTDSLYLNPSHLSFMPVYALSLNYLSYGGGPDDEYGHHFNVSAINGNRFPAIQTGIGFTRFEQSSMIHAGASIQFLNRIGLGIGGKLVSPRSELDSKFVDGTLSFSWIMTNWLKTAVIVDNLFEFGSAQGFNREFVLGTEISFYPWFQIYLDPNWSSQPLSSSGRMGYQVGVEFPMPYNVSLRVGGFENSTLPTQSQRGDGCGIGIGWLLPKVSLDYALSKVFRPASSLSHSVELTLYF